MIRIYRSSGFDPYVNQAIERAMLDMARDDTELLYLWQNDKTVFIGKNQNAYCECRLPIIEADGGRVARRISGGGAVYHDKGNINFTFFSSKSNFSTGKNFEIMMNAMNSLGFRAELSGRNDVLIGGRKFSGNAFYRGERCFHHGTVLIGTDREAMSRYLNVPKVKLEAKGVSSVASRVVNLGEIDPNVTADKVADALGEAFEAYYGEKARVMTDGDFDPTEIETHRKFFASDEWRLGDNVSYDVAFVARLSWGTADVRLKLDGTVITEARIYSDCLDTDAVAEKERSLVGADIYEGREGVNDMIELIKEQGYGF